MAYKDPKREKEYRKEYYQQDPEKFKEYSREWRRQNKGKYQQSKEIAKRWREGLRRKVLTHYGNGKLACVKCGFNDIRALSIDHINGGGHQDRKDKGYGIAFYFWLKKNNYPEGFQTLCMNCQFIKAKTNNECA